MSGCRANYVFGVDGSELDDIGSNPVNEYGHVVSPDGENFYTETDIATRARLARVLGSLGQFFTVSGLVTLLFVVYQLWGTGVQEAQAQENLRDDFASRLEDFTSLTDPITVATPTLSTGSADAAASDGAADEAAPADQRSGDTPVATTTTLLSSELRELLFPAGGEDIARIKIPSIGVDKIVVEGVSVDDLRKGPGRYQRSVLPGEPGNTAFAGHRTTYGAPFHNIDNLVPGDEIQVTSLLGEFTYRVVGQAEKNRVGFCVEEGYREANPNETDARSLRAEGLYAAYGTQSTTTTTTTTTIPPKDLPANFAVGAFDGLTFFATTDVQAELERSAQIEFEESQVEEELVVAAAAGVGRGAFDGIVDQPAELGHFIVSPADTCVLDDWGDNRITLTACHPKFSARQRIIVVAELVGEPAASVSRSADIGGTAGDGLGADEDQGTSGDGTTGDGQAAGAVGDSEGSDGTGSESAATESEPANTVSANGLSEAGDLDAGLGWDTSVLPEALMWGALTIVGYLLTQLAARRWLKWPAWAIGAIPVGFLLFLSFEQFDRLLPAY